MYVNSISCGRYSCGLMALSGRTQVSSDRTSPSRHANRGTRITRFEYLWLTCGPVSIFKLVSQERTASCVHLTFWAVPMALRHVQLLLWSQDRIVLLYRHFDSSVFWQFSPYLPGMYRPGAMLVRRGFLHLSSRPWLRRQLCTLAYAFHEWLFLVVFTLLVGRV